MGWHWCRRCSGRQGKHGETVGRGGWAAEGGAGVYRIEKRDAIISFSVPKYLPPLLLEYSVSPFV